VFRRPTLFLAGLAGIGLTLSVASPAVRSVRAASVDATTRVAALSAHPAIIPDPAYYRPVVSGGKVFPVARSNYLSYLEFPNSWHAPRLRLINGTWQLVGVHEGIDIMSERGTPILSMTSGTVETAGWLFYSGTRVGVRGDDGRYYFYAHLSEIDPAIAVGVRVSPGTILGRVGNTGYGEPGHRDEFPPHLHFGIQAGDQWVDPYPTLVSLYTAMVAATNRSQQDLDALAAEGRRSAFDRLAASVYMDAAPPGE
jgi:murein DD-endopeptidase MepM/ murein hydrolase activator NlpD